MNDAAEPMTIANALRLVGDALIGDSDPEADERIYDAFDVRDLLHAEADRIEARS